MGGLVCTNYRFRRRSGRVRRPRRRGAGGEPRFRFDGAVLSLEADDTTLLFELYVPDVEAVAEQARTEALTQAEAEGRTAQVAVLRAGVPSFDQYEQAMERAIDCARQAGANISGPVEQMPGPRLMYGVSGGGIAEHDRCYDEHAKYIDMVYQASIEQ